MKAIAMIHSKNDFDEVEIVEHISNNDCKAVYNGVLCTAIFNPFVSRYYVDDKYGVIGKVKEAV